MSDRDGPAEYLSERAASELFSILRYSLLLGVIGPDTFIERLSSLRLLVKPDGGSRLTSEKFLWIEQFPVNDDEELSPIFGDGLKDQAAAVWA